MNKRTYPPVISLEYCPLLPDLMWIIIKTITATATTAIKAAYRTFKVLLFMTITFVYGIKVRIIA